MVRRGHIPLFSGSFVISPHISGPTWFAEPKPFQAFPMQIPNNRALVRPPLHISVIIRAYCTEYCDLVRLYQD